MCDYANDKYIINLQNIFRTFNSINACNLYCNVNVWEINQLNVIWKSRRNFYRTYIDICKIIFIKSILKSKPLSILEFFTATISSYDMKLKTKNHRSFFFLLIYINWCIYNLIYLYHYLLPYLCMSYIFSKFFRV